MLSSILSFSKKEDSTPIRYGMYKNFRVGLVKYFNKGDGVRPDHLLVEVIESCVGESGNYYASYNLSIEVDKRFADTISLSSVGRWVLVGFYIQSFKAESGFTTVLKLRHYEELNDNNTTIIELVDPRIKNSDQLRGLVIPCNALATMHDISAKTKFQEYGKK